MASTYPGSLDSFDTIASDKKTSDSVGGRTHRDMHNDLGDAIEAVQTELGTDPAGTFATVKARLAAYDAYAAKTGAYTATVNDNTLNVTSGTFTLDLPAANTCTGKTLKIKNSGTGVVTLDGNSSETVEGIATFPLGKGSYVEITSTGTAWILTGGVPDTGSREVGGSIDADWALHGSAGFLVLRRVGNRVTLTGRIKRVTASGSRADMDRVYTIPTGFQARDSYVPLGTAVGPNYIIGVASNIESSPGFDVMFTGASGTWAADEGVFFTASWITDNAWPTSLPGTAA